MCAAAAYARSSVFLVFSWISLPWVVQSACTLRNPPPGSASCGVRGDVIFNLSDPSSPRYYAGGVSPQVIDNVEDCASLCFRRGTDPAYTGDCKSFFYDETSGECQISRTFTVAQAVQKRSKSHTIFYDRPCYDCGSVCAQPIGANVLDNGDFEETLLGPWQSTNGGIGPGNGGGRAWRTHLHPNGSLAASLEQGFNTCGQRDYTYGLRFDYRVVPKSNASATNIAVTFGLGPDVDAYGKGGVRYWNYYAPTADGETVPWTRIYGFVPWNYLSPYPLQFFPSVVNGRDGFVDVLMDNVAVFRVPSSPPTKPTTEVIRNGGFENGKLAPWVVSDKQRGNKKNAHLSLTKPGIDGKYALRERDSYYMENGPKLSQRLELKPHVPYLFTCNVRVASGTPNLRFTFGPRVTYALWLYEGRGNYTYKVPVISPTKSIKLTIQSLFDFFRSYDVDTDFMIDSISLKEFRDPLKQP